MNRQEKQLMVKSVKEALQQSSASFLVGVKGLTVEQVQDLRKGLRGQGGKLKVVKNTLLRLAASELSGLSDLTPYFKEQIAIVFAQEEAPAVAKVLYNISKDNKNLELIAGTLDSKIISKSQVEYLATLPSKDIMLAKVAGALQSPISAYVNILNQLILRFLWTLKKIEEKKNES